jgi:hypothetical protein
MEMAKNMEDSFKIVLLQRAAGEEDAEWGENVRTNKLLGEQQSWKARVGEKAEGEADQSIPSLRSLAMNK